MTTGSVSVELACYERKGGMLRRTAELELKTYDAPLGDIILKVTHLVRVCVCVTCVVCMCVYVVHMLCACACVYICVCTRVCARTALAPYSLCVPSLPPPYASCPNEAQARSESEQFRCCRSHPNGVRYTSELSVASYG